MRRHDFLPLCAAVAAFLAVRCSTLPIESAGGSSGTEVSARAVEGTAIDTTGKPIGGALVRLRRSSDLFGYYRNGTTGLQKNSLDTVTDLLGHFTLGPADTGAFTIELLSDDTLGATAACTVFAGDAIKRLAVQVLTPLATIAGQVEIVNTDSVRNVSPYVNLYGLQRQIRPDSLGRFLVRVPQGSYRFSFSADTETFDTVLLTVKIASGEYEDIGSVFLSGRPQQSALAPPQCLTWACDSSAVRALLDGAGHFSVRVDSVAKTADGRVVELRLRDMGLQAPLTGLSQLSALEILDLGGNNLDSRAQIPAGLVNLRTLLLDHNAYGYFDEGLGALTALKVLDVSYNDLQFFPRSIVNHVMLDTLRINNNMLCGTDSSTSIWADSLDPGWQTTQNCP